MKKVLGLLLSTAILWSCNSANKETAAEPAADTTAKTTAPPLPVDYAYKATYSSDWSIGDPKYTQIVLNFYKKLEADNLDDNPEFIEDSVAFSTYDQRIVKKSRAEFIAKVKEFRKGFKSLKEEFVAFVALHSNDKNEDFVCAWINETGVRLNGKPDATTYQENWRFRNGKIYFIGDYARYGFHK